VEGQDFEDFKLMKVKAYYSGQVLTDFVLLYDLCDTIQGRELRAKSITNDAEAVVELTLSQHGNRRIFYQDTQGEWDELKHDGKKFVDFAPIPAELKKQLELS
jgi:hypothetical protein